MAELPPPLPCVPAERYNRTEKKEKKKERKKERI
jgi:hypothetical protein